MVSARAIIILLSTGLVSVATAIRCLDHPVGEDPPSADEPPGFGGTHHEYLTVIEDAACEADGDYQGHDCTRPEDAGKTCAVHCRTDDGRDVGPWTELRVESSIVPSAFATERCEDEEACDDPEPFCSGGWPGQDNCGSATPKAVVAECEGDKVESVSWTFSSEMDSAVNALIPFCVQGEFDIAIGPAMTGTETWEAPLDCDPVMEIPGCERCPPDSDEGCHYSCSAVAVEGVMSADLHVGLEVYLGETLLHEGVVCDRSQGSVTVVTKEWAQPDGCDEAIDRRTQQCGADEGYGECEVTSSPGSTSTTSPTAATTSYFPTQEE